MLSWEFVGLFEVRALFFSLVWPGCGSELHSQEAYACTLCFPLARRFLALVLVPVDRSVSREKAETQKKNTKKAGRGSCVTSLVSDRVLHEHEVPNCPLLA